MVGVAAERRFGRRKEWDISDPKRQVSTDKLTVQGPQSLVGGVARRAHVVFETRTQSWEKDAVCVKMRLICSGPPRDKGKSVVVLA